LQPGAVLSVQGPLGAGKTTLVKGIARGLGIEEEITSPSFTLISAYPIPAGGILYHIDLYRIQKAQEIEDLGLEETLFGRDISIIEWGEKAVSLLPENHLRILIRLEADGSRLISAPEPAR